MIRPRLRHAAHHHVGIARGLDLLQAVPLDQAVELGVHAVEEADQFLRRGVAGARGEATHVGEQDRRLRIGIGDLRAGAVLQPLGDGRRKDVDQQAFRTLVLALRPLLGTRELPHRVEDDGVQEGRASEHVDDEAPVEEPRRRNVACISRHDDVQSDDQRSSNGADDDGEENTLSADQQDAERSSRQINEVRPAVGADN